MHKKAQNGASQNRPRCYDLSSKKPSHQYVYKYKTPEMGRILYQEYSAGSIQTEQEFLARLYELEAI